MSALLTQMINEASNPREFLEACTMAESMVKQGKTDTALVAHLAIKGHALIAADNSITFTQESIEISRAVMRVADAESQIRDNESHG